MCLWLIWTTQGLQSVDFLLYLHALAVEAVNGFGPPGHSCTEGAASLPNRLRGSRTSLYRAPLRATAQQKISYISSLRQRPCIPMKRFAAIVNFRLLRSAP